MAEKKGSILWGFVLMIIISILLFWLPILGPLIAGFVGGRKAGSIKNGIIAAILPALILAVIVFVALAWIPVIGALVAGVVFIVVVLQSLLLILGAIIGGATV